MAQADEIFGGIDIFAHDATLGRMKVAHRAQPDQLDAAIGKPPGDFRALAIVERGFDAVLVRGAQFDATKAGLLAIGDERGQIPIGAPLVRHESQLHNVCSAIA